MERDAIAGDVEAFWRKDYADGFMHMDAAAYAAAFALPALIMAEGIEVTALTTDEELLRYCKELIDKAKSTGWTTTTIDSLNVNVLSDNVATVTVEATRYDKDGLFITRLYGSYTVRRVDGQWRMAAIFGGPLVD